MNLTAEELAAIAHWEEKQGRFSEWVAAWELWTVYRDPVSGLWLEGIELQSWCNRLAHDATSMLRRLGFEELGS